MKKTHLATVAAAFALGAAYIIPAYAQDAAGIANNPCPTPKVEVTEDRRLYKDIATSTYGDRIVTCGTKLVGTARQRVVNVINNEKAIADMQAKAISTGYEKITSLDQVRNYTGIKKIGASLWGFPKESGGTPRPVLRGVSAQCALNAINAKDSRIISLNNDYNGKLNGLIEKRGDCQEAALATTTRQLVKLNKCANEFKVTANALALEKNKSHQAALTEYANAIKACSPAVTSGKTVVTPAATIDGGETVK